MNCGSLQSEHCYIEISTSLSSITVRGEPQSIFFPLGKRQLLQRLVEFQVPFCTKLEKLNLKAVSLTFKRLG